jgi:hypothetical protein
VALPVDQEVILYHVKVKYDWKKMCGQQASVDFGDVFFESLFAHYVSDPEYNYKSLYETNYVSYDNVSFISDPEIQAQNCIPRIDAINHFSSATYLNNQAVRAGTNDYIEIKGKGFGPNVNDKTLIRFLNADNAGYNSILRDSSYTYADSTDLVNKFWSDSLIKVKVPSLSTNGGLSAGSGIIAVTNQKNIASNSLSNLQSKVAFAVRNKLVYGQKKRVALTSDVCATGIEFELHNSFNDPSIPTSKRDKMIAAIEKSFADWNTALENKFVLALKKDANGYYYNTTSTQDNTNDNKNVVFLDVNNLLEDQAKMGTYVNDRNINSNSIPFTSNVHIAIDISTSWDFRIDDGNINSSAYDFSGIFSHEVGHAFSLKHVIFSQDLMYYAVKTGVKKSIFGGQNDGYGLSSTAVNEILSYSKDSGTIGVPTITNLPVISASNGEKNICIKSIPLVSSLIDAQNYVWFRDNQPQTINSPNFNADSATTYQLKITKNGCTAYSNSIRINQSNKWLGLDNKWSETYNWSEGEIGVDADACILNGAQNMPLIQNLNAEAKNITIGTGASLTLANNQKLNIFGDWTNNGNFINSAASEVIFSGKDEQNIAGNSRTVFSNVTVLNSLGGVNLQSPHALTNTFTMGNAAKFTALDQSLTLICNTVTGSSARIAAIPDNAIFTANQVSVQRYFPAKKTNRYISSPIANASPLQLQSDMVVSGYFDGNTNGFDVTQYLYVGNLPTVKYYVESVAGIINNGFTGINTITSPFLPGQGYQLFVRGDRNDPNSGPTSPIGVATASSDVTVTLTGVINQGTIGLPVSFTSTDVLANDGWNLVGNPYPSQIDWDSPNGWVKENFDNAIYIWDPQTTLTTSTNKIGAYVTYINGIATPDRPNANIIAPFQGFFVKANAANPVLTVNEHAKTVQSYTAYFRKEVPSNVIRIQVTDSHKNLVETVIRLEDNGTIHFDAKQDAQSLYGNHKLSFGLNTFSEELKAMAINSLPNAPNNVLVVPLYLQANQNGIYQLSFKNVASLDEGYNLFLVDLKDSSIYTISDKADSYLFEVTDSISNTKRYFLCLTKDARYSEKETVLSKFVRNARLATDPTAYPYYLEEENQRDLSKNAVVINVYPNPISNQNRLNIDIKNHHNETFELKIVNLMGQTVFKTIKSNSEYSSNSNISLDVNNWPSSLYTVILNSGKTNQSVKVIKQ